MKPIILVLIFSVFEYLSATIDNGYGYVNGYAMAVGGVSSVLSCGLFVASLQPSRLMKMVLCARHRKVEDHRGITRTVKTRWPAGDVTLERLLAFVLFMWWMVAAAFLKFDGPMAVKFNGYLSTFGALWAASLHVGETEVPPPAHRGPPPDSSPQLLYFFCCVLTLDEALDTSLEEAAEMVQQKLDEMGVGEEAQGYAVMAGDEELEQVLAVVLSSIGLCYAGLLMLAPDTIMRTCLSRAMEQILAVTVLTAALALAGVGTYRGPFLEVPSRGFFAAWLGVSAAVSATGPHLPEALMSRRHGGGGGGGVMHARRQFPTATALSSTELQQTGSRSRPHPARAQARAPIGAEPSLALSDVLDNQCAAGRAPPRAPPPRAPPPAGPSRVSGRAARASPPKTKIFSSFRRSTMR